jgi:hypothetical protein
MAKSPEIVDEQADMQRRFEELETRTAATNELVEKIAKKLLGEEPKPEPKGKGKQSKTESKENPVVSLFQNLGILASRVEE